MPNTSAVSRREAVYDINRYLHDDPVLRGIFGDEPPFWPTQSEPQTTVPYVRYVTRETFDAGRWWMRQGNVSYAVYAYDLDTSAHVVNVMVDLLGRGDESAHELMEWRRGALTFAGNPYPQDYDFHAIEFVGGHNTENATEEAGAHIRFATFRFNYTPVGGTGIV